MSKPSVGEAYVCGFICNIGIFAVGHLGAVFMGWSVTFCGQLILCMLGGLLVLSAAVILWNRGKKMQKKGNQEKNPEKIWKNSSAVLLPALIFAVLVAGIIWRICTSSGQHIPGDITLETVSSFLVTDELYQVSPLTGKPYAGPPLRYKILCLPTMYTLLCSWFDLTPELVVNRAIPLVVMGTGFFAYDQLAEVLFQQEKDRLEKKLWFLAVVAAVFLLYEGTVASQGYGILYGGHLGTTWRNCILLPFALAGALRKKWWQSVLCILAECCIVWTLWGMGFCLVATAGVAGYDLLQLYLRKKEDSNP